jgi:type IV pilus assembly protein PilE
MLFEKRSLMTGMTLIELVMVSAFIAIALSMAVPTYQQYVQRAHRTDAIGELLAMAACQERIRAFSGTYDTTNCSQATSSSHYEIKYNPDSETATAVYQLEAKPRGPQTGDICGSLLLDQSGRRRTTESEERMERCWEGR